VQNAEPQDIAHADPASDGCSGELEATTNAEKVLKFLDGFGLGVVRVMG
jgi:hypothetical protein